MSGISKIVTIMKKIMKPFVLVAAAAMALASCQKNEIDTPVKQEVHFTINAGIGTKTIITDNGDDTYTPSWEGNEELGVLFAAPNAETTTSEMVTFENASEAGEIASFQGTTSVTENGTFYSFYPASAFKRGYREGDARLDLNSTQKPTATSFDPSCDILIAKPYNYTVNEGSVVADGLQFARIMSVLKINLKSEFTDVQNDFVKSVSFTAAGTKLTGYARIFLDNPEFTGNWASSGDQYETVTANYDSDLVSINGTSNSVYLVVAPVTIPENAELTFTIETAEHNITKTITTHPEMSFSAGNVNVINLSIAEENCEAIDTSVDYSGEYLIAGVKSDVWYAANKYESGNFLEIISFEFKDETVVETDDLKNCYMTVAKVEGGDYDGMYTIQDAGGLYLSTVHNSENYLRAVESLSADTYWTLTKEDEEGTFSIVASKSQYARNDMRFNASSPRVSCYASSSNLAKPVLISTSIVEPDLTPSISVTETAISVEADATSAEFTYTVKNITETPTVSVKDATMTNVAVTVASGTVNVTFDANTEESAKTATIVLSYEGAESVEVTITQAAKPAEGEPEVKTWLWEGGGKANFTNLENVETKGLGSDYAASHAPYQIKMDGTGDYFIIGVDGAVQSASVGVKMIGGNSTSYLDVQGSSDGETFTSVQKFTISGDTNSVLEFVTSNSFDASYRYVKFYFTKGSNIGVGPISITYVSTGGTDPEPEEPAEPETPTYESLEDLVAAGAPSTTATKVNVTLENEEITEIFVTTQGYRNGVFLQAGDREIEIYCRNVPEEWVVGGTVSGTLTECDWKLYNYIWELCPEDWSELSYTAPVKTLTSIAVSGQTTEFTVGDTFEFGGIVTATYSDGSTADVTGAATFSGYNMSAEGSQTVTVTYEGQTTTYGITVNAAQSGGDDVETKEPIVLTADWSTNVGALKTSGLTESFSIGGYSYKASGASCYYYSDGKACFLGKSGAYVELPKIAGYKLTTVVLNSASTTGGATVTVKTTSNSSATSTTATFANGQSKEFSFSITDPVENTSYRICVTNAKNAHIAKWVLTYEPAN